MNIFRENESPLLEKSLRRFALAPKSITNELIEELSEDEDWLESNAMHSINGYLYGGNPKLNFAKGAIVRFYAFGFGSEASMHAPVWSGQTVRGRVTIASGGADVQILPFNAETVDVHMLAPGLWPVACGVADHVLGGMKACVSVS